MAVNIGTTKTRIINHNMKGKPMDYTKYFNEHEYEQLLENGSNYDPRKDCVPIVKLFMTNTTCTWLISELDPENPDIAFGLCDLGMGFPEIGNVSISEIEEAQNHLRILERDISFTGNYSLSVYARAAYAAQQIVTDDASLKQAVQKLKL